MVVINDHYERANALLASQFRDTLPGETINNMQRLLKAIIESMQEIDDQNQKLIFLRFLDTAEGVNLDNLAQIVGLARKAGQSDADYREDIKFQIFINSSNGTPEEVIHILQYLTNASKVWYFDMFPAGYQMATNGLNFPTPATDLVLAIKQASPAGVQYVPITAIYDTIPFTFSGDPVDELLWVAPNPSNTQDLANFEVDSGALIKVNAGQTTNPLFGGWFAEVDALNNIVSIEGAGQMAELIQIET